MGLKSHDPSLALPFPGRIPPCPIPDADIPNPIVAATDPDPLPRKRLMVTFSSDLFDESLELTAISSVPAVTRQRSR